MQIEKNLQMTVYVFQKYLEDIMNDLNDLLNDLKTRTPMYAKISVCVNCIETIIYLLYNLQD